MKFVLEGMVFTPLGAVAETLGGWHESAVVQVKKLGQLFQSVKRFQRSFEMSQAGLYSVYFVIRFDNCIKFLNFVT
jgi:hypothetical protein